MTFVLFLSKIPLSKYPVFMLTITSKKEITIPTVLKISPIICPSFNSKLATDIYIGIKKKNNIMHSN